MNKEKTVTLKQVIAIVNTSMELFASDFCGPNDEMARLLHKHYTNILRLLKAVK